MTVMQSAGLVLMSAIALTLLLSVARAQAPTETCKEPLIVLPAGTKRHYKVGVLSIRGPAQAYTEWNQTFNPYLSETAGKMFDPPLTFSMEALDFVTLYTSVSFFILFFCLHHALCANQWRQVETKQLDFIYVNPSAYSCIESEHGASSLVTQRSIRVVGKNTYITTEFGGVVFTRADRDDLQTLQDLKGRSFAAASISGLGSGQAQFRTLRQRGLDYLNDPVQVLAAAYQPWPGQRLMS